MTDLVERYSLDSFLAPDRAVRVMRPELGDVPVHWHDFYELCLVVSGAADHVVNGAPRRIGPGSAFLLSPADLHAIQLLGEQPLCCYNTVIDPRVMERVLAGLGPSAPGGFPWQAEGFSSARDFDRLETELAAPQPGGRAMSEALVTCLVVELTRCSGEGAAPELAVRADRDDVRRAVLWVDRNFREPLTLADAAARAHLSPNYFSERFREVTGSSFQEYVQARRLVFARSLLTSTSLSVTEICHASGFNNLSHFGRAYRRRFRVAPSGRQAAERGQ